MRESCLHSSELPRQLVRFGGLLFQRDHFHRFASTDAKRVHANETVLALFRIRQRYRRITVTIVRAIAHRKGNHGVRVDQAAEGFHILRALSRTHGSPNASGAQRSAPLPSKRSPLNDTHDSSFPRVFHAALRTTTSTWVHLRSSEQPPLPLRFPA